ncbi:MAG: transketolase [Clostridia bacterium]|nr:transketolase [Clostridia bacterium]
MIMEKNVYSKSIVDWGKKHPETLVLSADLGSSCEIMDFKKEFPDRYLSMGIAEQNMVSWAAGLAREGYLPYLHTFGVFLYRRVLDQVEMSVAYGNLPVGLVGFVPGLLTPGGVSHQSTNDIASLRAVPNMRIYSISDATDIEGFLPMAYEAGGPFYVRMLRKEVPRLFPANETIQFNHARVVAEGTDVALFTESFATEEGMKAVKVLQKHGVSVQMLAVSTLKPFTDPQVVDALKKVKYGAVTYENHNIIGGLGTCVAEVIAENGLNTKLVKCGVNDEYTHGASKMYLLKKYNVDAMSCIKAVEKLIGKDLGIDESEIEEVRFEDYNGIA